MCKTINVISDEKSCLGYASELKHLSPPVLFLRSQYLWFYKSYVFNFREATKNGHGHGAYNLVAGHLQGYNTDVEEQ